MRSEKVRHRSTIDMLNWLEARLSADDQSLAAQRLASVEEALELPFRRLLWLYHGHDQVEGAYGQMVCSVRLRMSEIEVGSDAGDVALARAQSFAARTADFRNAPPETLALHIQGSRPQAAVLGAVVEGPDPTSQPAGPSTEGSDTTAGRQVGQAKEGTRMSPAERALRGRIGAYTMLARNDPRETTKAARAAFESKFAREVDPDGVLEPAERARRAEMARKAHQARLTLASVQARRNRTRPA